MGYLPESPPIYPEMTVQSYLRYVTKIKDVARAERAAAVDRALERCGLGDVRGRVIGTLSKGYRQRVGLAQAIVHDPPVLILDEPTVGLDPIQIREIRNLISTLASERPGESARTVILSTHILPEVEALCRRVMIINGGQKVVDSPLDELRGGGTLEEIFTRETARDSVHAARGSAEPGAGDQEVAS